MITKEIFEGIQVPYPKILTFYLLSKTHKNLTHPPGRPIVSGVGSKTERASKFVNEYLHPHVITLPSYIKDTSGLLCKLDGLTVPPGCFLVAIDIEALYSSIPHNHGIEVISRFLGERGPKSQSLNNFVLQLLSYILGKNVFSFDKSHFLQVQGVAMGMCCAPSYANLYLGGWERDRFSSEESVDLLANVLCWFHYIDDILMLWAGTAEMLDQFMNMLSTNGYNLKFTMQSSTITIAYLDITINIGTDGTINT